MSVFSVTEVGVNKLSWQLPAGIQSNNQGGDIVQYKIQCKNLNKAEVFKPFNLFHPLLCLKNNWENIIGNLEYFQWKRQ